MSRLPPEIARAARECYTSAAPAPVYLSSLEHPGRWWRWQTGHQADPGSFVGGVFVPDPPIVDHRSWLEAHG